MARLTRAIFLLAMTTTLGACSLVPGMQFSANVPIDPNDPTSVPTVIPITPELVHQQQILLREQAAKEEKSYTSLLGRPKAYRIGPNDVLAITIWDHPELISPNLTYTIGPTGGALPTVSGSSPPLAGFVVSEHGDIQLPYAGLVNVGGLTEIEAQKVVAQRLKPFIRDPQITLRVGAYLSKHIYIGGEVKTPGVLAITGVPMTLPAALSAVGGVLDTGDESRIILSRHGKSYDLSLPGMLADGVNPNQIVLHSDDIIRVLPRENYKVVVTGEVLQPKAILMRNNGKLTLSEALGEASGVRPDSSAPNAIYVVRASHDGQPPQVFHLDSKSPVGMALAENFELKAKDVVYVDATGLVRWNRLISLLLPTANSIYTGQRIGDN